MTLTHGSSNQPSSGTLPVVDPKVSAALKARESLKDMSPALFMIATLGAAAIAYFGTGQGANHVVGFARTTSQTVASMETGRLASVQVSVGDKVSAGQIVALLDTTTIDAEIAVAEAQRSQLSAELLAEQALLEQRLDQEVEGLQRERARQREEQARVTAEAKVLDGEVARVKRLIDEKQAVSGDLTQLGIRQASVGALAATKPGTLGLLGKQIKTAQDRLQKAKDQNSGLPAKLTAALLVADRNIELLKRRREGHLLRAGRAGRISTILRWPGDVVDAEKPVLQIVSAEDRVVACVPEQRALGMREGDIAVLRVRGQSSAPLHGKTVAVGPLVTELPARCWVTPRVPLWGREVTVALDEAVELLPGQAFDISFTPGPSVPAPAAGPNPTTVAPINVPDALFLRTRIEPSGILAQTTPSGFSRYLVVSDDTGQAADEGEPWLFAMSPQGVMEPDPIPISGLRQINDIEAITAGQAGDVFLLSSQSYSKKGKRKPTRTALLRLAPQGLGFQLTGETHLAEALDQVPEVAHSLGLVKGTADLDMEGLSYKDGALYMGIKAPLNERGEALIWRVGNVSALFSLGNLPAEPDADRETLKKRLEAAEISVWAQVKVDVELGGQTVPGGISDLLFLPNGALAISATPSILEGEAGALYRVNSPASGVLKPTLVEKFPSLKPEGIAPSFTPGRLMVVFDTGNRAPMFQEISWSP